MTAIPPSAQLAVDAVDVDSSGMATVVLVNTAQTVEPDRRRAMWAQFVATLLQAPTVVSVALQVQGIGPIPVPNLPTAATSTATLGYTDEPALALTVGAVRIGKEVQVVNPQDIGETNQAPRGRPFAGSTGSTHVPSAYTGLALSADGTDLAGVAASRRELVRWRGGVSITAPYLGDNLTDPAYDIFGWLWVAGIAKNAATVWTLPATSAEVGAPAVVRVDWLAGRQVLALRISPDGTRAAVVSTTRAGTDSRLDIAGIQRDANGLPSPSRRRTSRGSLSSTSARSCGWAPSRWPSSPVRRRGRCCAPSPSRSGKAWGFAGWGASPPTSSSCHRWRAPSGSRPEAGSPD